MLTNAKTSDIRFRIRKKKSRRLSVSFGLEKFPSTPLVEFSQNLTTHEHRLHTKRWIVRIFLTRPVVRVGHFIIFID